MTNKVNTAVKPTALCDFYNRAKGPTTSSNVQKNNVNETRKGNSHGKIKIAATKQGNKSTESKTTKVIKNANTSANATETSKSSNDPATAPKVNAENQSTERPEGKSSSTKHESIFVNPPLNYNRVASEVIHADCTKHGYRVIKTIGEGAYAKVKLAEVMPSKIARFPDMTENVDDEGSLKVAIKVIDGRSVPKEFLKKFLPRELSNHGPLPPHRHVVRVYDQFKSSDRYYVVMEYCSRGDLLDLINQHIGDQKRGLSEDKARKVFAMLVHGVHHIHNQGIVHRDLKCENILLDKDENVKITDFGFSTTFLPGQNALLKTSCGSYAYTAPEVIRVRPYDGTKSDIWSLGIILFAMLNGRLPFNDAQLCELDEEMKMQRLRFERSVSFDSMVFVRRMLQYQPSTRPTMTDIIADPWLTGRLAIPRQPNKPRWTNNYDPKKTNKQEAARGGSDASMGVGGTQPIYYKTANQKRGSESAVAVNRDQKETIVLKSRTTGAGQKKNIWIRGPPVSQRPKTWPRTDRKPGPQPPPTRTPSAGHRNSTATVVVTKLGCSEHTKRSAVDSGAKNIENIKLSKWFMDKYMAGKEASFKNNPATNCACCKAEAEVVSSRKQSEECVTLENGEIIQAAIPDSERFSAHVTRRSASGRDKVAKPPSAGALRNRAGPGNDIAGRGAGLVNYMVKPSTSPRERVKYFRDRLLRIYGNDEKAVQKCDGNSGLPHLLVQPLKTTPCPPEPEPPRTVQSQTRKSSPSPTRAVSGRSPTRAANGRFPTSATTDRQTSPTRASSTRAGNGRWASASGSSWRQMRGTSGKTSPVKPKQRVVVHSSIT